MQRNRHVSRRQFLLSVAGTINSVLLAACGATRGGDKVGQRLALGSHATPQIVLPSPMPVAAEAMATPTPALADFLRLSHLLTGLADLSPTIGQIYLQSLQASAGDEATLAKLVNAIALDPQANPTAALAALESSTLLTDEPSNALAKRITEMWYTGIYKNEAGEDVVATYVDALAWQTLRFTKPKTICGEPGFWAQEWRPSGDEKTPT